MKGDFTKTRTQHDGFRGFLMDLLEPHRPRWGQHAFLRIIAQAREALLLTQDEVQYIARALAEETSEYEEVTWGEFAVRAPDLLAKFHRVNPGLPTRWCRFGIQGDGVFYYDKLTKETATSIPSTMVPQLDAVLVGAIGKYFLDVDVEGTGTVSARQLRDTLERGVSEYQCLHPGELDLTPDEMRAICDSATAGKDPESSVGYAQVISRVESFLREHHAQLRASGTPAPEDRTWLRVAHEGNMFWFNRVTGERNLGEAPAAALPTRAAFLRSLILPALQARGEDAGTGSGRVPVGTLEAILEEEAERLNACSAELRDIAREAAALTREGQVDVEAFLAVVPAVWQRLYAAGCGGDAERRWCRITSRDLVVAYMDKATGKCTTKPPAELLPSFSDFIHDIMGPIFVEMDPEGRGYIGMAEFKKLASNKLRFLDLQGADWDYLAMMLDPSREGHVHYGAFELALCRLFDIINERIFENEFFDIGGEALLLDTHRWIRLWTKHGEFYWFSMRTGRRQWDRPADTLPPLSTFYEKVLEPAFRTIGDALDEADAAALVQAKLQMAGLVDEEIFFVCDVLSADSVDMDEFASTCATQLQAFHEAKDALCNVPEWCELSSRSGEHYFYNKRTGDTSPVRPAALPLPADDVSWDTTCGKRVLDTCKAASFAALKKKMKGRKMSRTSSFSSTPPKSWTAQHKVIPLSAIRRKSSRDLSADPSFKGRSLSRSFSAQSTSLSSASGSDAGEVDGSDFDQIEYSGISF